MVKLSGVRKLKHCGGNVTVGYSEQLKMYIMCIKITDWLVDYDRWYSLSESEFKTNDMLKSIYEKVKDDYKSDRFLFSWRKNENNTEQTKMLHSIIGDSLE